MCSSDGYLVRYKLPVSKCPNGKYRIGSGGCNFSSKAKAEAAYKAYLSKKHESIKQEIDVDLIILELIKEDLKELKEKVGETDGHK